MDSDAAGLFDYFTSHKYEGKYDYLIFLFQGSEIQYLYNYVAARLRQLGYIAQLATIAECSKYQVHVPGSQDNATISYDYPDSPSVH